MRYILFIIFLFISLQVFAQFPANPRKMVLGYQTTADGIIYRASGAPAFTPSTANDARAYIDTDTGDFYVYNGSWIKIESTWIDPYLTNTGNLTTVTNNAWTIQNVGGTLSSFLDANGLFISDIPTANYLSLANNNFSLDSPTSSVDITPTQLTLTNAPQGWESFINGAAFVTRSTDISPLNIALFQARTNSDLWFPQLIFERSAYGGSYTNEAAVTNGTTLGSIEFYGRNDPGLDSENEKNFGASIRGVANENFTATEGGTSILFTTMTPGTVSPVSRVQIDSSLVVFTGLRMTDSDIFDVSGLPGDSLQVLTSLGYGNGVSWKNNNDVET